MRVLTMSDAELNLLILQDRATGPIMRQICERLQTQLQAMASILDSLLDLSSLERGAVTAHICDFKVHDLHKVALTCRHAHRAQGVKGRGSLEIEIQKRKQQDEGILGNGLVDCGKSCKYRLQFDGGQVG